MTTPARFAKDFALIEAAAIAGERCPQGHPHGPLCSGAITSLVEAGHIRSEVYKLNYRVAVILTGPHKGRSTAPPPGPREQPWKVNGLAVRRFVRQQSSLPAQTSWEPKAHKKFAQWPEEKEKTLARLAGEGYSSSQIAHTLGVTRNTVIGKLRRLGVPLTGKHIAERAVKVQATARPRPPPLPLTPALTRLAALRAEYKRAAEACDAPPSPGGVTILELQAHHCKWPNGEPGSPGFRYCGDDRVEPLPYCSGHARIAYTLPTERRQARVREAA